MMVNYNILWQTSPWLLASLFRLVCHRMAMSVTESLLFHQLFLSCQYNLYLDLTSLTLVCAYDFRTVSTVSAPSREFLPWEWWSKKEGFRRGNAESIILEVIALISQNCYQRKCGVPRDPAKWGEEDGERLFCFCFLYG